MKAHKDLRSAIMNGMTPEQQKELATLITEYATAAKDYGMSIAVNGPNLQNNLQRANRAWNELGLIGLPTKF